MAYKNTAALERRIASLRQPWSGGGIASGLAQAIRSRKAGKLETELEAAESNNDLNQQRELAMILRGQRTGRVGDSYASATLDQFSPSDPALREITAKLLMDRASSGSKLMEVSPGASIYDPRKGAKVFTAPDSQPSGSELSAAIRNYEYWKGLPEEERSNFITANRNPYLNTGGEFTNIVSGETIPKSLAPNQTPEYLSHSAAIELDKLEQSGLINNQQRIALEEALTPILTQRAVDTQRQTGDISVEQNLAEATGRANIDTQSNADQQMISGTTDRYFEQIPKAEAALQTIRAMDQFVTASPDSPAGSFQPVLTGLKNLVASFGGDPTGLTETMLMDSALAGSLSSTMNSMGARGLTDADMSVLSRALPQIATSRQAREEVAAVIKRSAERVLTDFSQSDASMRANPTYQNYMPPLPWLDEWRGTPQGDVIEAADRIIYGQ